MSPDRTPAPPGQGRGTQTRREKILAWVITACLTLTGLFVSILELKNLISPQLERPSSNLVWLLLGLATLILGVSELCRGPTLPGRRRHPPPR